jgi:hypothetical protein
VNHSDLNVFVTSIKPKTMNELINQIEEKAQQVLNVMGGTVKEKFPAPGEQTDSVVGTSGGQSGNWVQRAI